MPRNIRLIAIGKAHKESKPWLQEYEKRLNLEISEIKESTPQKEGREILKRIKPSEYTILLDKDGRLMTSREFSELLAQKESIAIIIGGPEGASDEVKQRANLRLSFGSMTMAHQVARLVMLEQLYRAKMIQKGHPYHK